MRKLFVYSETKGIPTNAEEMYNLFIPKFSLVGSNKRELEEQVVTFWVQFIEIIAGKTNFSLFIII